MEKRVWHARYDDGIPIIFGHAAAAVRHFTATYSRTTLTWQDLRFLRERTKLPILLKGILHPDDAKQRHECYPAGHRCRPSRLENRCGERDTQQLRGGKRNHRHAGQQPDEVCRNVVVEGGLE